MKTYLKDYTPAQMSALGNDDDYRELMCARHEKFRVTAGFLEAKEEVMTILQKLKSLLPEESRSFGKLEDTIFWTQHVCYGAGYSDGIADLMTSMTFNKLGLTKVEYYDLSKKGA